VHIYIVDDDRDIQASLGLTLRRAGHEVQSFGRAGAFLSVEADLTPGCVMLDLCLPDSDGLAVQSELAQLGTRHVIILLSGFGDVPDAVHAMRAGALDFLKKPFRRAELFDALDRAQGALDARRAEQAETQRGTLLETLSTRERDVLMASADGDGAKQVAFTLDLSVRTVEMHRANILKKLKVPNFGAALLLAQGAGMFRG